MGTTGAAESGFFLFCWCPFYISTLKQVQVWGVEAHLPSFLSFFSLSTDHEVKP